MAIHIPQSFVDELLGRVDIIDVLESKLTLKKAGSNFNACCPFHTEKTPSFIVFPRNQNYHCFGCGAHGDAITFLREFEHFSYPDAVKSLADSVGLALPESQHLSNPKILQQQADIDVLEKAAMFYENQLKRHPQAKVAVEYLKKRGLTGVIAKTYRLGFAPPGRDILFKALSQEGITAAQLIQAGLAVEKEGRGLIERFRNRVMFPIRDKRGRVVGFGGRILDDTQPKYLNSPETATFQKGRELYGCHYFSRKHLWPFEWPPRAPSHPAE